MTPVVLDASVLLSALLPGEDSALAASAARRGLLWLEEGVSSA